MRRYIFVGLACSFALVAGRTRAEDGAGTARVGLHGFRYVLKPALAYDAGTPRAGLAGSASGQDVTFALSNHFGWALPLGPLVFSPGAGVPLYFFSNDVTLGVLAEVELHLPLGWASPYLVAGGGGAFFFGGGDATRGIASQRSGVFRGGAGVTVFPRSWLGVGVQGAYVQLGSLNVVELSWPIELRF